jgi:hypothetical protein
MAQPKPLDLGNDDVFALTRDYEALRTSELLRGWELLRGFGVPVTVAELAGARKLAERVIHRQLDLLIAHKLVEQVRARNPGVRSDIASQLSASCSPSTTRTKERSHAPSNRARTLARSSSAVLSRMRIPSFTQQLDFDLEPIA